MKRVAVGILCLALPSFVAADQTNYYYVVPTNAGAAAPYMTWETAATNLQAAVGQAQTNWGPGTNCIVIVTNGTYRLSASLTISNGITVRSLNGATATVLRAAGSGFSMVTLSSAATNASLDGFTITGGNGGTSVSGGGVFSVAPNSAIRNCVLAGNAGRNGGALYIAANCTVSNCVVTNNWDVTGTGGGAGGGACVLGGTVRFVNCLFAGNDGHIFGGGLYLSGGTYVLENCTITGNKSADAGGSYGGGVYAGSSVKLVNCIVYNNQGDGVNKDNYVGATVFSNCCTTPLPLVGGASGVNNIGSDPQFMNPGFGYGLSHSNGNYRLSSVSPCMDTGTAEGAPANDIEGNPRPADGDGNGSALYDMGAYEALDPTNGPLRGGFTADRTQGLVPLRVVFTSSVAGANTNDLYYGWTFGDGNATNGAALAVVTNIYAAGSYAPSLTVSNSAAETVTTYGPTILSGPPTVYVATNGGNTFPYDTWGKAALTVQSALLAGVVDGTNRTEIVVSNGTYTMTIGITMQKGLILRSANGVSKTTLKAAASGFSVVTLSSAATNAVLDGFTITGGNGSSSTSGGIYDAAPNSAILNCNLAGNGGRNGGALFIAADCAVSNCVVTNNYDVTAGGGGAGGGACVFAGSVRFVNCLFAGNDGHLFGGGLYLWLGSTSVLENCTITGNKCADAGGSYGGGIACGGVGRLINCIVYNNQGDGTNKDNYTGAMVFSNCCTTPLPLTGGATGTNNMGVDPSFVSAGLGYGLSHSNGGYRLADGSPCVNAGTNATWMIGAVDLAGLPRLVGARVDIGAYELPRVGTLIALR
jgi:hypothetical protein